MFVFNESCHEPVAVTFTAA